MFFIDTFHTPHDSGCFFKDSTVRVWPGQEKPISELKIGDWVLSINSYGEPIYSEVILFMDRDLDQTQDFVQLTTETGAVLTLTPAHLVRVWKPNSEQMPMFIFADRIKEGDRVFVYDSTGVLRPQRVDRLRAVMRRGVVAPLTRAGTIVVNSVAASCYAVVNSQTLAHWSLAPMRLWATISSINSIVSVEQQSDSKSSNSVRNVEMTNGIHWYANILYTIKNYILPRSWRY